MLAFFGASAAGGVIVASAVAALQVYNPKSSRNLTQAALQTHGAQIEALQRSMSDMPSRGEMMECINALIETTDANHATIQERIEVFAKNVPSRNEVANAFKQVGAMQRQQQAQGAGENPGDQLADLRESLDRATEDILRLTLDREDLLAKLASEREQNQADMVKVEAAVQGLINERNALAQAAYGSGDEPPAAMRGESIPAETVERVPVKKPPVTEEQAVAMNPLNARKDPAMAFASQAGIKERIAALREKRAAQ